MNKRLGTAALSIALAGCAAGTPAITDVPVAERTLGPRATPTPRTRQTATPAPGPDATPTASPTASPTPTPVAAGSGPPIPVPTPDGDTTPLGAAADGRAQTALAWRSITPATGLVLDRGLTLGYRPGKDVTIALAAVPGSQGATVAAYEVAYEYTTPAGKPKDVLSGVLPLEAPVAVAAGAAADFGPAAPVTVTIGLPALEAVFKEKVAEQPGLIQAYVEFKNEAGLPIADRRLTALRVPVLLRVF